MTCRGHHPTVKRLHGEYRDGVRVPAKEMKEVEALNGTIEDFAEVRHHYQTSNHRADR